MDSGSGDKKRIEFRAPERLVERADALATALGTERTDILLSAVRNYLRDATDDDELTQEIAGAYYDGDIGFDQLEDLLGHEEAVNVRILKEQLHDEFIEDVAEDLADS